MLLRALLAFLALPGVVAIAVPLSYVWLSGAQGQIGVPGAVGFAALLWCVRDFYVAGKGTLAPWAPPQNLVRCGLYRYSRNPMYVAVSLILIGWALGYGGRFLWIYAACVMTAFQLRVVYGEEPWLAKRYGAEWAAYCAQTGRWITIGNSSGRSSAPAD